MNVKHSTKRGLTMGEIKKSENKIQDEQYHLEPVQITDEELQSKKYYKVDFFRDRFRRRTTFECRFKSMERITYFFRVSKKST